MRILVFIGSDIAEDNWNYGDIISVHPDNHRFGNYESLEVWVAGGGAPEEFPSANMGIIDLPGEPADVNLMDAAFYETGAVAFKRGWSLNLKNLSRTNSEKLNSLGGHIVLSRGEGRRLISRKTDGQPLPPRLESDDGEKHRFADTEVRAVPTGFRGSRG